MKKEPTGEDFKHFKIPENYFNKLYEFTGSDESSKGFIVAYVSQDGCPMIYTKVSNPLVEMGLIKAIEKYLNEVDNAEDSIDLSND